MITYYSCKPYTDSGAFRDLYIVVTLWSIIIIGLMGMIQSFSKLLALIYSKKESSSDIKYLVSIMLTKTYVA